MSARPEGAEPSARARARESDLLLIVTKITVYKNT